MQQNKNLSKLKYSLTVAIILAVSTSAILLFNKYEAKKLASKKNINLEQIKKDLSEFIINSLDKSLLDFSLNCSDYDDCEQISKDPTEQKVASITWKILFYANLYKQIQTSHNGLEQEHLQKALDLTDTFLNNYSNQWNSQAFVFADAYLISNQIKFLKAFFHSSAAFVQYSVTEKLFDSIPYKRIHPMTLARYAEQVLLTAKLLSSTSENILNSISYSLPNHQENYQWLLNNKQLISSKSTQIAERMLNDANNILNNNAANHNVLPLFKTGNQSLKQDVCWVLLGNALAFKETNDPKFLNKSKEIVNSSGLLKNSFDTLELYYSQPLLACLNSLKILNNVKQISDKEIHNFTNGFLDYYLDSKQRTICAGTGGILNKLAFNTEKLASENCELNSLKVSDNVWFYTIISSMNNAEYEILDSVIPGEDT